MIRCARCGRTVNDFEQITPDAITEELIDSIDHGKEDLAGKDAMKICAECMDELGGD